MFIPLGKKARRWGLCLGLVLWVGQEGMPCYAAADDGAIPSVEFSGSLVKTVKGRQYHAQVFAKGDRLRLEYKYAIRTERGYAAIEIIRLDKSETWYLLAQQKELLVTGLDQMICSRFGPPYRGSGTDSWLATRRRLVVQPNSSKFRQTIMVESSGSTNGWTWIQEWS